VHTAQVTKSAHIDVI